MKFKSLYAGAPSFKDDTQYESLSNKGALLRGKYKIVGKPFNHPTVVKFTLRLQLDAGNKILDVPDF